MSVFRAIVDRSTMLQRLEVELTEKCHEEMVYYALEKRGRILREVTIDLDKNQEDNLWTWKSRAILIADMMQRISELSPTGELTCFMIGNLNDST